MIRHIEPEDFEVLCDLYRQAFSGFPWNSSLSSESVSTAIRRHMGLPGFDGIVLEVEGAIVAASWWDMPSLEAVHQERGEELATLVFSWLNNRVLVWERELAVFPDHQGRGYGRIIRGAFLNEVAAQHDLVLVGTRMREDNTPTIVIGERLGFYRTGIRVEAVEKPGCWHEYWLCELPNNM